MGHTDGSHPVTILVRAEDVREMPSHMGTTRLRISYRCAGIAGRPGEDVGTDTLQSKRQALVGMCSTAIRVTREQMHSITWMLIITMRIRVQMPQHILVRPCHRRPMHMPCRGTILEA